MWWTLLLCILLVQVPSSWQDLVTGIADGLSPKALADIPPLPTAPEVEKAIPTIRSLRVTSEIKYRYSTTLVSARVVNTNNQSGEASFTLTLPESAFISQFLMEVEGKVYKAYVKEKEEAKETYEEAVQEGRSAGHVALDARDSNLFTVSVNLEALGSVTFNLTYEQLLSRDLGLYSNVINIDPKQIVDDMSVTVEIEEPSAIMDIDVPEIQMTNEIEPENRKPNTLAKIEHTSANHTKVSWAPTPEEQKAVNITGVSGQFIVRYDVDRNSGPLQILVDQGYFVHFFAPEDLPKLRRHVVFVLDYSASMEGRKLKQLKHAMRKILPDLGPKDFFSIVVFQSYIEAWSLNKIYVVEHEEEHWILPETRANITSTLDQGFVVEATHDNILLAQRYLENYSDLGATNIMGGLRTGLELVNIGSEMWTNESDPPRPIMVFLTDGQPNVEVSDGDEIINKTKPLNTKECPIYSLAFGYNADFNFLRKLSLSNFGFARTIYEAADAGHQLERFYRTIASPLLTNVTFTYLPGQVDNSSNTKVEFPMFFNGSELVVSGKLNKDRICVPSNNEQEPLGELTGLTANGPIKLNIFFFNCFNPPLESRESASHLEKMWAFLSIQQLLDKSESLDPGKKKDMAKARALELALQYSFVTPLTSLVVVKPDNEESDVDPARVKPGDDESGWNDFSSGPKMAAPGAPRTLYKNALSQTGGYSIDDETQKLSVTDIKWLQPYLASGNLTISILGVDLVLGMNETDTSFGACTVKNEPGECRHFKFCALDFFRNDISLFTPYLCPIPNSFLGVCCPQSVS